MAQISAAQADAMGIPSIPDISNMTTGGGRFTVFPAVFCW